MDMNYIAFLVLFLHLLAVRLLTNDRVKATHLPELDITLPTHEFAVNCQ